MAALEGNPKTGRKMQLADPPMLGEVGKAESDADLSQTYHKAGIAVGKGGIRLEGADASAAVMANLENQIHLKDLDILEVLGRGASAVVKRAVHKQEGTVYVVKCFNMMVEANRHMLIEEVKLMMAMNCDSIVRFKGAFLDDCKVDVILEHMDRGSLEDLVAYTRKNQVAIPEKVLAGMTFQMLWGLAYLNVENMMHRDIKPPNVLMNSAGGVKLADFGIGKKMGHTIPAGGAIAEEEEEEDIRMTSTTVGTTKFMSPERLEGLPYNHTGDIWSLGLILAEFISGVQPMRKCRSEVEQIQMLKELPSGTLGEVLTNNAEIAALWSSESLAFVSWCLAVDMNVRGGAADLMNDAWFAQHLNGSGMDPAVLTSAQTVVKEWLETEEMAGYVQPGGLVQTEASVAAAAAIEQPTVDTNYATMAGSDSESDDE